MSCQLPASKVIPPTGNVAKFSLVNNICMSAPSGLVSAGISVATSICNSTTQELAFTSPACTIQLPLL